MDEFEVAAAFANEFVNKYEYHPSSDKWFFIAGLRNAQKQPLSIGTIIYEIYAHYGSTYAVASGAEVVARHLLTHK